MVTPNSWPSNPDLQKWGGMWSRKASNQSIILANVLAMDTIQVRAQRSSTYWVYQDDEQALFFNNI